MSISFGSASKKPYVGSKEVQEAYVGNQLVYRATPPYVYAFLGTENDYLIQPWCQLTQYASVTNYNNVYAISITSGSGSTRGNINISLTDITPLNVSVSYIWNGTPSKSAPALGFYNGSTYISSVKLSVAQTYTTQTVNVPQNTTSIRITCNQSPTLYLNAIWLEK